jgi:hypothetical protein
MKKKEKKEEEGDEMSKIKEVILVHGCMKTIELLIENLFLKKYIIVKRQK